jgi:hypothetical protein
MRVVIKRHRPKFWYTLGTREIQIPQCAVLNEGILWGHDNPAAAAKNPEEGQGHRVLGFGKDF